MPSKPILSSLLIPSFEISTKDFEHAFLFNTPVRSHPFKARPVILYESSEDEINSTTTSPSTPRSSIETFNSESPMASRISSLQSSPHSANLPLVASKASLECMEYQNPQLRSEAELTVQTTKPRLLLSRFNASSTSTRIVRQLESVAENTSSVPATPTRSTVAASATASSDSMFNTEDAAPPILPRYFALSSYTASSPPPPLVRSPSTRRSIASSPWTCLEGAHHPLCSGNCDIACTTSASSYFSASPPPASQTTPPAATTNTPARCRTTLSHSSPRAIHSAPVRNGANELDTRARGLRRAISWTQRPEGEGKPAEARSTSRSTSTPTSTPTSTSTSKSKSTSTSKSKSTSRSTGKPRPEEVQPQSKVKWPTTTRTSLIRAANAYGSAIGAGSGGGMRDGGGSGRHGDVVLVAL